MSGHFSFGTHPLVSRFLKGVFTERPSLPRYQNIWDMNIVLNHLKQSTIAKELSLKDLTLKLVMLMALLSGQRCQTLQSLSIDSMKLGDDECVFHINKLLKTTKPGSKPLKLCFKAFPLDKQLCVLHHLLEYMQRTKGIRENTKQLLVAHQKPHKAVSTDTISRWIKTVLQQAKIDVSIFKAHSTRAAARSAANLNQVPIDTIMASAGWSSENTFAKFYKKPIMTRTPILVKLY